MFKKSFAGKLGSLVDVRQVQDPWDIGISVGILRSGHSDFTRWQEKHRTKSKIVDLTARVSTKALIARQIAASQAQAPPAARPGFRQERKLTHAEKEAARLALEEQTAIERSFEIDRRIIDANVDSLSTEELIDSFTSTAFNDLKVGLAVVLMRDGWTGILDDESGQPADFTLHNRLKFVGWEGYHIVVPLGVKFDGVAGEHFLGNQAYSDLDPAGELAQACASGVAQIAQYTGNPREESGELMWVDKKMMYGPNPLGDAITIWLMKESQDGDAYLARVVRGAADFLGPTPDGKSGISAT